MSDERNSEKRRSHGFGIGFSAALGLPAGMIFGFVLNNIAVGLVFGLSIGMVFALTSGANWSGKSRKNSYSADECENSDSAKR
jgi:hypothetical protein